MKYQDFVGYVLAQPLSVREIFLIFGLLQHKCNLVESEAFEKSSATRKNCDSLFYLAESLSEKSARAFQHCKSAPPDFDRDCVRKIEARKPNVAGYSKS